MDEAEKIILEKIQEYPAIAGNIVNEFVKAYKFSGIENVFPIISKIISNYPKLTKNVVFGFSDSMKYADVKNNILPLLLKISNNDNDKIRELIPDIIVRIIPITFSIAINRLKAISNDLELSRLKTVKDLIKPCCSLVISHYLFSIIFEGKAKDPSFESEIAELFFKNKQNLGFDNINLQDMFNSWKEYFKIKSKTIGDGGKIWECFGYVCSNFKNENVSQLYEKLLSVQKNFKDIDLETSKGIYEMKKLAKTTKSDVKKIFIVSTSIPEHALVLVVYKGKIYPIDSSIAFSRLDRYKDIREKLKDYLGHDLTCDFQEGGTCYFNAFIVFNTILKDVLKQIEKGKEINEAILNTMQSLFSFFHRDIMFGSFYKILPRKDSQNYSQTEEEQILLEKREFRLRIAIETIKFMERTDTIAVTLNDFMYSKAKDYFSEQQNHFSKKQKLFEALSPQAPKALLSEQKKSETVSELKQESKESAQTQIKQQKWLEKIKKCERREQITKELLK